MKTVTLRGVEFGAGRPKILASVCGKTEADVIEQASAMVDLPVDIAEWRLDWFDGVFDIDQLIAVGTKLRETLGEKPILATFRSKGEGGEKEVEPKVYADLNLALVEAGLVDAVDIEAFMDEVEVPRLIAGAHAAGVPALLSNHDFDGTPAYDEMMERMCKMQDMGADIVKISYMPNTRKDVLSLLDATRDMYENHAKVPLLGVSMGGLGTVSRMVGELVGSGGTFGAAKQASAPGQVSVVQLEQVLETIHAAM